MGKWGTLGTCLAGGLLAGVALAASPLEQVFIEGFAGGIYVSNRCGQNILKLAREALDQGADLSQAQIVRVQNAGNSNFGMVKGYRARGRSTGKANWDFHVFLVDRGLVYDFDYTDRPRVAPIAQYVREMFEGAADAGTPALADYRVDLIAATSVNGIGDTLTDARPAARQMALLEYLGTFDL